MVCAFDEQHIGQQYAQQLELPYLCTCLSWYVKFSFLSTSARPQDIIRACLLETYDFQRIGSSTYQPKSPVNVNEVGTYLLRTLDYVRRMPKTVLNLCGACRPSSSHM